MRKTSLKAFESIRKKLKGRQQMVATQIMRKPGSTIRDVAKALKTYPHCISGRFSALETLGIIKDVGIKKYKDGIQPHTKWEVIIK